MPEWDGLKLGRGGGGGEDSATFWLRRCKERKVIILVVPYRYRCSSVAVQWLARNWKLRVVSIISLLQYRV